MKLLFITDNFIPETNAPATRTYEHCKEWAKKGMEVTVITCAPNFPKGKVFEGYRNKIYQKEKIDGINVIRVWTYITANEGSAKRIIDYASFMLSSFIAGLFIKTDLIIATSPQFFTVISGRWLSFWKRKKWVMEVRDIWPESIKAVGAMKDSLVIHFFEYLEKKMYVSASKIVVVTDSFKRYLIHQHKVSESKIEVVKNGIIKSNFLPSEKNSNLLKKLNLENKFVVGYIGTHGMAHALDFILASAAKINNKTLHFLLVGDGAKKAELLRLKEELKLQNVTMIDNVPKEQVVEYISILDIGLVNLKKSETFKSVIPSKIFELCAMQKPILIGVEGEAKEIVENYNVGVSFEPENFDSFQEALNYMSLSNRSYSFEKILIDFDRKFLATKMLTFLKSR
ncbi:glycosyltransferase family 4 protein [Galbibacter sp. BG1]|uniref:glycosyltransferase family 4 protein n=1 Tax=Galbibacter sp. BG1 TaxID=1170699 RepID=UPI0015BB75DA|nr:glycosyltransferase family 4 protein [Galbibacter sp. BG1]QLE02365.1 glycosyltransferase family 4 protein [Galbibacter sp. BG1]